MAPRNNTDHAHQVIKGLFNAFADIRYVAVYREGELAARQKIGGSNSSSADSDKYEELLVNPTLLTLARQRGNIDCGGLRFLVVAYGNFYQLVKEIDGGHISICLDKNCDIAALPEKIFESLRSGYENL